MKIALIQMLVTPDKEEDLAKAREMVLEAARNGAEMAILPEMFCCPYANEFFPKYAEEKGGRIYRSLSETAAEAGLVLVGGSFPELVPASEESGKPKLYNTCFVFDADGKEMAFHRKAHLFDIDVEGGQHFHEIGRAHV